MNPTFKIGQKVVVTYKEESFIGTMEERFTDKSPCTKTEMYVNIPLRFPNTLNWFLKNGFTVTNLIEA